LWVKAPLLLRRHPPVLAAVVLMSLLAALAAASPPLVRAGAESQSLKEQVAAMSPLTAGFELVPPLARVDGDAARRAAAEKLARDVPFLGAPVVASTLQYLQIGNADGNGVPVVPMARTGAVAHVHHLASDNGPGVWISSLTAQLTHLRPGGTLRLTVYATATAASPVVSLRVAGIYRRLDTDFENPYWGNWLREIVPASPDSPPQPQFVLMSQQEFLRVVHRFSGAVPLFRYEQNRYEFPVDPTKITFTGAKQLLRRFDGLRSEILRPGSQLGRSLGCFGDVRGGSCSTSSSLDAALAIAASDVAAVSPTISLLSDCGLAIAAALCLAAGIFLVRRRGDETHVVFVRGESAASFAARTAVEATLPAVLGAAAGLGAALLVLGALAPGGTIAGDTVSAAAWRAAGGCVLAVACIAAGAAGAYPRRGGAVHRRVFARVPWEIVPLATAGVLLGVVLSGGGLAHDPSGGTHPRLAVFALPVLAAAGVAGLAVRAARLLLRPRAARAAAAIFFALRRLGAARGLLVAVVVAAAAAFSMYAYAATLTASLDRSTGEKAYVSNGSDVQAVVDPGNRITSPFPFPAALVEIDQYNASFPSGARVDLVAGDPAALRRTLLWGDGWKNDPRPLLPRLETAGRGPLAAIATPGAPSADAIFDQGARIPIRIVGRAVIPGTSPGRPALLVSREALRRVARRAGISDPGPQAAGLLWAKGDPKIIEPALVASNLAPAFLTRLSQILEDPSVGAAERSYRYVRVIGLAAAVLSLVALLLYLQARQRSQLIASALVRRMGAGAGSDAAALALEAGAIVLFATVIGAAVATAFAKPIVGHVDALPLYAPAPTYVTPWTALIAGAAAATVAAVCIGAVATLIAARSNVAEALRVA
jgi:hypothetical protein